MDFSSGPILDYMYAKAAQVHNMSSSSYTSDNPPPLKRRKHSMSSSLDLNDNSSMEYDNNSSQIMDYRREHSLEYQTEASIFSQDMMTCSSTCTSSIYPRPNLAGNGNHPVILKSNAQIESDSDRKSLRHKRRFINVGSDTFGSCSTNMSQSSTLTELSQMGDDIMVQMDDLNDDLAPPNFLSRELYIEENNTASQYKSKETSNDLVDTMMIDSLVSSWDQNFVLHAPTIYHTNRRTKAQVQHAKRSMHRIHFQS